MGTVYYSACIVSVELQLECVWLMFHLCRVAMMIYDGLSVMFYPAALYEQNTVWLRQE